MGRARPHLDVRFTFAFTFDVAGKLASLITGLKGEIMASVLELIAEARTDVLTKFDDAIAQNKTAMDTLNARVAELEAKIATGEATAEEIEAMRQFKEDVQKRVDVLNPDDPTVLPDVQG